MPVEAQVKAQDRCILFRQFCQFLEIVLPIMIHAPLRAAIWCRRRSPGTVSGVGSSPGGRGGPHPGGGPPAPPRWRARPTSARAPARARWCSRIIRGTIQVSAARCCRSFGHPLARQPDRSAGLGAGLDLEYDRTGQVVRTSPPSLARRTGRWGPPCRGHRPGALKRGSGRSDFDEEIDVAAVAAACPCRRFAGHAARPVLTPGGIAPASSRRPSTSNSRWLPR